MIVTSKAMVELANLYKSVLSFVRPSVNTNKTFPFPDLYPFATAYIVEFASSSARSMKVGDFSLLMEVFMRSITAFTDQ